MTKYKSSHSKLGGGNPFQNIDKTSVLQECRTFNESPVNARKCTHILTKILYLINQVCVMILIFFRLNLKIRGIFFLLKDEIH